MAETKKKMVSVRLPLDRNPKADQEVRISCNFAPFTVIKRGVTVEVPEEIYEGLMRAEEAELEALDYSQKEMEKSKKVIE